MQGSNTLSEVSAEQVVDESNSLGEDFLNSFKYALERAYTPDGVDLIDKTLNGDKANYKSQAGREYRSHPITFIAGFLGLPNRKLKRDDAQSWANIGRNFIGWQENASIPRLIVNLLLLTPLHILALPFKFATNLLRIFTEVIPGTLAKFILEQGMGWCGGSAEWIKALTQDAVTPPGQKILRGFGYATLFLLGIGISAIGYGFYLLNTIGCYLTSPFSTIRNNFKRGYNTGGVIGAAVLGGIAIFGVLTVYGIALPLLTQAIFPVLPYIVNSLPDAALNVFSTIAIAIEPVLTAVGGALMPMICFASKMLTFGLFDASPILTAMPPMVGLGSLLGAFIATVGTGVNKLVSNVIESWHTPQMVQDPASVTHVIVNGNSDTVILDRLGATPQERLATDKIKEAAADKIAAPAANLPKQLAEFKYQPKEGNNADTPVIEARPKSKSI